MVTMTAKQWYELGVEKMPHVNIIPALTGLRKAFDGAKDDVMNTNGNAYYQWSMAIANEKLPQQVIELGGAMGVWDVCMLNSLPSTSKLYSITLPENGLEYSFVVDTYPNFVPTVGDDLDLSFWPKDLDWKKTEILFIDTLHEEGQLRKELELYLPLIKPGTLVMLDDIHLNEGMNRVWDDLNYDKFDATDPLHYSGFGLFIYE